MAASLDDLNSEIEDIASDLQNISERLDDFDRLCFDP